jgi:uncharacterized protein (DUF433 family)
MARPASELFTPMEAAAIAEVPKKFIYRTIAERLPKTSLIQRSGKSYLTLEALICVRLDYELPRDVPVKARRFIFRKLKDNISNRVEYGTDLLSYVVDPRPIVKTMTQRIERYRRAMKLIVEDPEIQGGAATFKGTQHLVRHIADLLRQNVPEVELREEYTDLTQEMIEAARMYVRARPRRGRKRNPTWRRNH